MSEHIVTKYVYTFSPDHEPVAKVGQGEVVTLETLDCFSNQIHSEEDELTSVDFSKVNPATGPVYVEGAEPGDYLVVDILDVQVAAQGIGVNGPGMGPLQDKVTNETKLIHVEDGKVKFNDMEFPMNPMIGVIGVAPKEGEIPCGMPGAHGGNLDNKLIKTGARLYFPVHVEGALFQCGDLHAAMGDGEISGAGLEVAGTVKVKFDVVKGGAGDRPVLETEDKWYTIATAEEFNDALKLATSDMQDLLVENYGWDKTEAAIYMSLQGDAEVCQACVPSELDLVLRFGVPKRADKPLIKSDSEKVSV
ncbi:MAG TPA: acetamidase/formamidase family protein [Bacillota bacterium]|nr:acetamidase/formamidase family protein [Bacillota bacterium]